MAFRRSCPQEASISPPKLRRTVGVVCDGMGGPAGGRVASQIAVSVYLEELEQLLTADQTPQQLLEASAQAAALANQAIQAEAERREECRNMGTTLVSAISYDGGVVVTNVGDSRAYHITEDGITRVTKDHSLVEIGRASCRERV